jgi:hypothetical protein
MLGFRRAGSRSFPTPYEEYRVASIIDAGRSSIVDSTAVEQATLGPREGLNPPALSCSSRSSCFAVFLSQSRGHHGLVQWLLQNGANVNARSAVGSGGSALHSAAWNGDLRMVKLLVAAGADVNARDPEHDNTPAGWAEVAIGVTNNPKCKPVAEYLFGLMDEASS